MFCFRGSTLISYSRGRTEEADISSRNVSTSLMTDVALCWCCGPAGEQVPGESLRNPEEYSYEARLEMVGEAVRRLRSVHEDGMADVISNCTQRKDRLRFDTRQLMDALLALPVPPKADVAL